jgi:anti-sigma factor RsiW
VSVPCEDLNIWIERFRDGDLAGRALVDAQAHLEACDTCRERLAELEQIGTVLEQTFAEVEPPIPAEELSRRIAARLDAVSVEPVVAASGARAPWQYALAAAVAGFVVVSAAMWLVRRPGPGSAPAVAAIPSVSVQLADASEAVPARLVTSDDPDIGVVWIGTEGPQP